MPSFCTVFNCSNHADREKDKSNYCFHSVVKNNGKEGLKRSKVRRQKWLGQFFWKVLTERKLERTRSRIKIMLSASLSLVFFTQSSQYQIWKGNTYSNLTVIELGPPVSESSTRISKFYMTPLILNTNFIKWESKIGYS